MKDALRFTNSETGEIRYVHGLKDFIMDIYTPNQAYAQEYTDARIDAVTKQTIKLVKKANRRTFVASLAVSLAGILLTKKYCDDSIGELKLKVHKLEKERELDEYFDEDLDDRK